MGQATAGFSTATYPFVDPLVVSDVVSRGGILDGATAAVVKRGTVMELAGGKWFPVAVTAMGILADDCDATTGDASCIVYVGGVFMASGLIWNGKAHDIVTEQLRDMGIQLESVVVETGAMVKSAELPTERVRKDDTAITKDLHPKEILTDHGPLAVFVGGEKAPEPIPLEPHPSPLRTPPGADRPPDEDEDGKSKKSGHTPPPPPKADHGAAKDTGKK